MIYPILHSVKHFFWKIIPNILCIFVNNVLKVMKQERKTFCIAQLQKIRKCPSPPQGFTGNSEGVGGWGSEDPKPLKESMMLNWSFQIWGGGESNQKEVPYGRGDIFWTNTFHNTTKWQHRSNLISYLIYSRLQPTCPSYSRDSCYYSRKCCRYHCDNTQLTKIGQWGVWTEDNARVQNVLVESPLHWQEHAVVFIKVTVIISHFFIVKLSINNNNNNISS